MQQAAIGDCLSFDPFPFDQNGLAPPEVDVGGRQVADALVISQVIVVGDEGRDLGFEIARQVIVFEQDAVLERLMPALDLALGHRMIRRAADMLHVLAVEPFGQVRRDVAGAVVGEKPWPVDDLCLVEPRGLQRHVQRGGDILGLHGWAQLPGDDVAREVVEDGRQVEPAPTDDF